MRWLGIGGRPGEQAELAGAGDRLGPVGGVEFAVDALDLASDGVDRNIQLAADLAGRQLRGD